MNPIDVNGENHGESTLPASAEAVQPALVAAARRHVKLPLLPVEFLPCADCFV
jgi:hypothetical protein